MTRVKIYEELLTFCIKVMISDKSSFLMLCHTSVIILLIEACLLFCKTKPKWDLTLVELGYTLPLQTV